LKIKDYNDSSRLFRKYTISTNPKPNPKAEPNHNPNPSFNPNFNPNGSTVARATVLPFGLKLGHNGLSE